MFELLPPGTDFPADGREPEDYEEPCGNLVVRDGEEGHCGGKVVSTGGHHYYNGHYDCYTLYLDCENCGPYEVECV